MSHIKSSRRAHHILKRRLQAWVAQGIAWHCSKVNFLFYFTNVSQSGHFCAPFHAKWRSLLSTPRIKNLGCASTADRAPWTKWPRGTQRKKKGERKEKRKRGNKGERKQKEMWDYDLPLFVFPFSFLLFSFLSLPFLFPSPRAPRRAQKKREGGRSSRAAPHAARTTGMIVGVVCASPSTRPEIKRWEPHFHQSLAKVSQKGKRKKKKRRRKKRKRKRKKRKRKRKKKKGEKNGLGRAERALPEG